MLGGWGQELGSLGLPDAVHERLTLCNLHYRFLETIVRIAILTPNRLGASQLLPLEDISRITVPENILRTWNLERALIFFALIFFSFSKPSLPPHRRLDGEQGLVLRKASNIALFIMHASVMGSPVMDALRCDGSRRCFDSRALLGLRVGYSSYDS